jgi:APA family basic amino acid/polyamine antiporter
MIGSGVFMLPAALAVFGTISLVAWTFTSIGAILLALVFAQLSKILPKAGGPYAYCREAYGDFVGFQVAYCYWIAVWVGNAAIVVAMVGYLSVFWPALKHDPWWECAISIGTVWLVTGINCVGVWAAGKVQLITTVLKLLPLVIIAIVGVFFIDVNNLKAFNISNSSNFSALTAAATLTLWSFIGFESATVPADDIENPRRNIPLATIIGTIVAAVIYIFGTLCVMGIIPMAVLAKSSSPYADAAQLMFGPWGSIVIGIAAVIACFGTLNGWILLQGQVPHAAASDGLFPRMFAATSKNGTPVVGLVISSVLITGLLLMRYGAALVDQFTFMITLATLASLIPYVYTTMAGIMIALKNKETFSRGMMLKVLALPSLAFAYSFWAVSGAGQEVVFYGVLLLISSVPMYVFIHWKSLVLNHEV